MKLNVADYQHLADEGESDDEMGSLESGLASRRTVEDHEKPIRYQRKTNQRADQDEDY